MTIQVLDFRFFLDPTQNGKKGQTQHHPYHGGRPRLGGRWV